jgi:peptidoglycan-associated lipoprotein
MPARNCSACSQKVISMAVVALLLVGCAAAKPVEAKAPHPPPIEPLGRANAQPVTPNTPTAANVVIAPDILRACNIPDADAYFEFDSSRVTSFDQPPLGLVASCFTRGPMAGRNLRLVGHADPRGTADYNLTLGQSRADAVAGYLVGRGLRASQASTTSRGAMDATGLDETGWAHDRRVDVYLQP